MFKKLKPQLLLLYLELLLCLVVLVLCCLPWLNSWILTQLFCFDNSAAWQTNLVHTGVRVLCIIINLKLCSHLDWLLANVIKWTGQSTVHNTVIQPLVDVLWDRVARRQMKYVTDLFNIVLCIFHTCPTFIPKQSTIFFFSLPFSRCHATVCCLVAVDMQHCQHRILH